MRADLSLKGGLKDLQSVLGWYLMPDRFADILVEPSVYYFRLNEKERSFIIDNFKFNVIKLMYFETWLLLD